MTNRSADVRSEAIWRAVEANRANYVSAKRLRDLERALARAETEALELKTRLVAFETSTIWGLTKPIRRMVQLAKGMRSALDHPDSLPSPSFPAPDPTSTAGYQDWAAGYQDWIDHEEPALLATLLRSGTGHTPIAAPQLGMVLWTDDDDGARVARDLEAAFATIPPACAILVACSDRVLAAAQQAASACGRLDAVFAAVASGCAALPVAVQRLTADYLCFHHLSDRIGQQALEVVRAVLSEQPQTALLFADEDWLGPDGARTRPFFKPDWDAELQRGQDLVGPFAFYAAAAVQAAAGVAGPAWRYGLASRVAAMCLPERIRHVAAVLCHRVAPVSPGHTAAMRAHAAEQLQAQGIAAEVHALGAAAWQRIVYAVPRPEPLVSVVIPTRDRAELLRVCTDGVLNRTDYRPVELIIMDNGTEDPEALALLAGLAADARVRVLRRPGAFNWSALNNDGARHAAGEVLLLLNNDVAVLRPDWLGAMVAQALQPGVGAVGAKLLYQDGRVQHAGITTDRRGIPRHLLRFAGAEDPGPYGMLALARSVWGVTGACLAVQRALFAEVGGLNEGLPVAYNDVELCLRLTVRGYRTVWTPAAVLEHRELASRPPDHVGPRRAQAREELNRLHRDWGSLVLHDPYLPPHFDLTADGLHFHRSRPGLTEA